MSIVSKIKTGWPNKMTLKYTLGKYCHDYYHIKVGITNNPQRRFQQHRLNANWQTMHIIYKTSSYKNCTEMESILVTHFQETTVSADEFIYYNERDGGAGRIPEEGPFYVYVLLSKKYCRGMNS